MSWPRDVPARGSPVRIITGGWTTVQRSYKWIVIGPGRNIRSVSIYRENHPDHIVEIRDDHIATMTSLDLIVEALGPSQ